MDDSKEIFRKLRAEKDTLNDLRAKLLLAKGDAEKAEKTRQRIAHTALTGADEKAQQKLETTEDILAKSAQRIASFDAAIAESDKRQAQLQVDYDEALREEKFQAIVASVEAIIAGDAVHIDAHFVGGKTGVDLKPLAKLLPEHRQATLGVDYEFKKWGLTTSSFATQFRTWSEIRLYPPRPNVTKFLYGTGTSRYLELTYTEVLKEHLERIIKDQKAAEELRRAS
jgi:hypothetical protein